MGDPVEGVQVHTSVQTTAAADETRTGATVPNGPSAQPLALRRLPTWAIPSFGLMLGITFLVAYTLDRRISTDVFWQMAAGQWMLAHHSVMGLDPYSYTESHRRWVADEWGSEVVLASAYKAFGAAAYNIVPIVTGTMSLVCATLYARALGARGGRLATIAVLLSFGTAGFITQDRGLSFSLIWLPLELLVLTKARTNPRWLCWLPLLCLLWVNTHGSILVGLGVLGIELLWSMAPDGLAARLRGVGRSPHTGALGLAALASVLAACVSPYGPGLLTYDLGVATNSQIGNYIKEWQSPDFHQVMTLAFVLVPLAVLVMAVRRPRIMLLESTLTVAFLLGALHSARVEIYLMVAAAGLAASLPARHEWGPRARRVTGALAMGLLFVLVAIPSVPAGSVTTDTPVQAFNYLETHPGRIFTQYTWGDYSIARHRATFVDGRTDLFTGTVLSEFFAVTNLTTNPDPILARYHVDYVVWAPGTPLAEFLARDPQWSLVDRAGPALVFARR